MNKIIEVPSNKEITDEGRKQARQFNFKDINGNIVEVGDLVCSPAEGSDPFCGTIDHMWVEIWSQDPKGLIRLENYNGQAGLVVDINNCRLVNN